MGYELSHEMFLVQDPHLVTSFGRERESKKGLDDKQVYHLFTLSQYPNVCVFSAHNTQKSYQNPTELH